MFVLCCLSSVSVVVVGCVFMGVWVWVGVCWVCRSVIMHYLSTIAHANICML